MRIYKRGVLVAALAGCLSLALTATTIAEHGRSQDSPGPGFRVHVEGLGPGDTFGIDQVYKGFWCNGGNESPALRISGVPAGTGSLAITIFDPDAPTQSGWWHWLVYDLPASTTELAENASAISAGQPGALPASLPSRDRMTLVARLRTCTAASARRRERLRTTTGSPSGH